MKRVSWVNLARKLSYKFVYLCWTGASHSGTVLTSCTSIELYRGFKAPYCLHHVVKRLPDYTRSTSPSPPKTVFLTVTSNSSWSFSVYKKFPSCPVLPHIRMLFRCFICSRIFLCRYTPATTSLVTSITNLPSDADSTFHTFKTALHKL